MDQKQEIQNILKAPRLIFGATCLVVLMLLAVPIPEPRMYHADPLILAALLIFGAILLIFSFLLPKFLIRKSLAKTPDRSLKKLGEVFVPCYLVKLGLCEAAMVVCFSMSLISGYDSYRQLLGLGILFLLSYQWPQASQLEELAAVPVE